MLHLLHNLTRSIQHTAAQAGAFLRSPRAERGEESASVAALTALILLIILVVMGIFRDGLIAAFNRIAGLLSI